MIWLLLLFFFVFGFSLFSIYSGRYYKFACFIAIGFVAIACFHFIVATANLRNSLAEYPVLTESGIVYINLNDQGGHYADLLLPFLFVLIIPAIACCAWFWMRKRNSLLDKYLENELEKFERSRIRLINMLRNMDKNLECIKEKACELVDTEEHFIQHGKTDVKCPGCGGAIVLKDHGSTYTIGCEHDCIYGTSKNA
jgi:hypothetical protein